MSITSFRDLVVWQRSIDLVESIYDVTKEMPSSEKFGINSQVQRAAVSIASNIAEGSKRSSRKDFSQFCRIAQCSAAEVETQIIIINRIYSNINTEQAMALVIQIQKMLTSLNHRLSEPLSTINQKL